MALRVDSEKDTGEDRRPQNIFVRRAGLALLPDVEGSFRGLASASAIVAKTASRASRARVSEASEIGSRAKLVARAFNLETPEA